MKLWDITIDRVEELYSNGEMSEKTYKRIIAKFLECQLKIRAILSEGE